MSGLAIAEQTIPLLFLGIANFVVSGLFIGTMLLSKNLGSLLGLSIGCLVLYIMMKTCVVEAVNGRYAMADFGLKFINSIGGIWKMQYALSLVAQSLCFIFTLAFPQNTIFNEILWLISNIFALFPMLIGAYTAVWALNLGFLIQGYFMKDSLSPSYKFFKNSYLIYKNMLIVIAMIGILLFAKELQSPLMELLF
ncbi:MAG: hypothetical protein ACFFD7_10685 [Candidatus Thorarchaeota archaeon]